MPKYRKIQANVKAEQIKADAGMQKIETSSGELSGRPGDWIITAANGDRWFVEDEIFSELYLPAGADNYQTVPVELDAEQHSLAANAFELKTLEGTITVSPGDWVITGVKGERHACKPDHFRRTYERIQEQE